MILFNSIFPGGLPLKDLIAYPNKVKFAKLGDSLLYDTLKESLYGDINITSIYANNKFEATGGNITPNILIKLPWTKIGYSGNEYPQQDINTYTVSYSADLTEGFTLNTTTGEVICSANTTEKSKLFTVLVTITMNISGDKEIIYFDFTLNAGEKEVVEKWVTEEITINSIGTIPPNENTINLTTEAKRYKYYYTYINGDLDDTLTRKDPYPIYENIIPTYSVTGTGFSIINNTQLHVDSRGEDISGDRLGTITATYYENGKEFTALLTVTQAANGKVKVVVPPAEGYFTYYPVSNEGCLKKAIDEMNIELLIEENYLSGHYVNNSRPLPGPIETISLLLELLSYPEDYWFGIVEPCFDSNETGFNTNACEVWEGIGAINWTENTTGLARLAKIGLFVCTGVENGMRKYECVMESTTIQQEIVTYKINDTLLNFTAANSTKTPTITCTKYIEGEASGEPFELTDYTLIEIEGSDSSNGFTTNGKNVSVSANEGILRTAKFTISVGQNTINPEYYESGILTCTLNADTIKETICGDINVTYDTSKALIPASGGEGSISAKATQEVTYIYVSGVKKSETINLTNNLDGREEYSCTIKVDSLGTTPTDKETEVLSKTVQWTGKCGKSTSAKLIIRQEANKIEKTELQSIAITNYYYNVIDYKLGSLSSPNIKVLGTYVDTYTSKVDGIPYSKEITDYTSSYTLEQSLNYFKIDSITGVVTARNNNTDGTENNARVTVTVLNKGKQVTATATVTLESNILPPTETMINLSIKDELSTGWTISNTNYPSSTPISDIGLVYKGNLVLSVMIPVYVYRMLSNGYAELVTIITSAKEGDTITVDINAT